MKDKYFGGNQIPFINKVLSEGLMKNTRQSTNLENIKILKINRTKKLFRKFIKTVKPLLSSKIVSNEKIAFSQE